MNRLDLDVAHARECVGDPFLHGGRHLGETAAVLDGELQLGAGAATLELDAEPATALAQPGSVDGSDRAPHDLRQRDLADAYRAGALLDEDAAHDEPASAGSRAPASSRKDVEYSPLRNSSLSRMSRSTSRVVGTPSISSSSNARSARAIARRRLPSRTTTFAISES